MPGPASSLLFWRRGLTLAQADLERHVIFLPQPQCWDDRHEESLPHFPASSKGLSTISSQAARTPLVSQLEVPLLQPQVPDKPWVGTVRVPANCSCLEILEGEGFPCLAWHSLRFRHTTEGQKFYGLCPQMGKYRSRPYSHLSQHRQRLCCVSGAGSQRDCPDTRPGQCVCVCVCTLTHDAGAGSRRGCVIPWELGATGPGCWEPNLCLQEE